jgi:chromosome transmission fidelity protein 1
MVGAIDLIPTLLSLSTAHLPYHTLEVSLRQVCAYMSKFRLRLSAKNLNHLKRLVVFLDALKKTLIQWKEKKSEESSNANRTIERSEVLTPAELLDQMGRKAAGINLLEVGQYLKESRVSY